MLLLEKPWTRQPQKAARVNPSSVSRFGIVAGFVYAPANGGQPKDIWTGAEPTLIYGSTVFSQKLTQHGFVANWTAGGISHARYIPTGAPNSRSFTFLCRIRLNTAPSAPGVVFRSGTAANGTTIPLWRKGTSWDMRINGTDYTDAGAWSIGQWYDVEIVADASSAVMYVDGVSTVSGSVPAVGNIESVLAVGDCVGGGFAPFSDAFDLQYLLWSNRPLSDVERRSFRRNPWQLFEPRRIWVPQSAAAGLPALSASTYKPGTLTSNGWTPRITAT